MTAREEGEKANHGHRAASPFTGAVKGHWRVGEGPSWNTQRYEGGKGGKDASREGKSSWQKGSGKNGGKVPEKGGKGRQQQMLLDMWQQQDTLPKGGNKNLCAIGEEESEVNEGTIDNKEEKVAHRSLLGVENDQSSSTKHIIEVKDN